MINSASFSDSVRRSACGNQLPSQRAGRAAGRMEKRPPARSQEIVNREIFYICVMFPVPTD